MSLFGKKKSNWIELDQKHWTKEVNKLPYYRSLKGTVGEKYAAAAVEAMWRTYSNKGIASYMVDNKKYFPELDAKLKHEQTCVLRGNYYIGQVYVRATTGNLHRTIMGETMQPSDYGAKDSDDNLQKATRYIINSSSSLKKSADKADAPITEAAVKSALHAASLFDVRSETVLRDLHRRCVNQAELKPSRAMSFEAAYPSTGGAAYLLTNTFSLARGIPYPPAGDPRWFDLACFLFGAVIRSHGFTDGNGRVGRAAYAATMLKGGLPFAPLKVSAEKELHGLDQVS